MYTCIHTYIHTYVHKRTHVMMYCTYIHWSSLTRLFHCEGLSIYAEVGYLAVGSANGAYITSIKSFSESIQHPHTFLRTGAAVKAQFPYVYFGAGVQAVHTPRDAGLVNPRSFVAAQKRIAGTLGCHVTDDVVHSVQALEAGVSEF